jgi:hypothetical protein
LTIDLGAVFTVGSIFLGLQDNKEPKPNSGIIVGYGTDPSYLNSQESESAPSTGNSFFLNINSKDKNA